MPPKRRKYSTSTEGSRCDDDVSGPTAPKRRRPAIQYDPVRTVRHGRSETSTVQITYYNMLFSLVHVFCHIVLLFGLDKIVFCMHDSFLILKTFNFFSNYYFFAKVCFCFGDFW